MKLLVKVIFSFVSALVEAILLPINLVVVGLFPSVSTALSSVNNLLSWVQDFTAWTISWLPFDSNFYSFTLLALICIYSIPVLTNLIKLIVKWWHYLVP